MSLRYEEASSLQAATRGDGYEGENVTANVRTVKDIPKRLKRLGFPRRLRGAGRNLHGA